MEKNTSFFPIKTEPLILNDQSQENTEPLQSQEKTEISVIERFFKIMTPDSHIILRLPPAFCKNLKAAGKSNRAVINSRKGTWYTKIGECINGQLCFEDGWSEFVEAHDIEAGDFVVFEHKGSMQFMVFVHDSSGCEKEFYSEKVKEAEEEAAAAEKTAEEGEAAADFGRENYERANRKIKRGRPWNNMSTEFTVKIYKHFNFHIPKHFWKMNKLEGKTKVLLIGPSGEACTVKIGWINGVALKFNRCTGWIEFWKSNGLKDGDICTFHLSSDPSTSNSLIKFNVNVIQAPNNN